MACLMCLEVEDGMSCRQDKLHSVIGDFGAGRKLEAGFVNYIGIPKYYIMLFTPLHLSYGVVLALLLSRSNSAMYYFSMTNQTNMPPLTKPMHLQCRSLCSHPGHGF